MRLFTTLVAGATLWAGAVFAQADAIRSVIQSQLDAFQANDLASAFEHASPMIKGIFGDPQRFGQMVQNGYPMVWRPEAVEFGGLRDVDGTQVQSVFFTDSTGRVFEAAYEMIEGDGGWMINGVAIREADIGA